MDCCHEERSLFEDCVNKVCVNKVCVNEFVMLLILASIQLQQGGKLYTNSHVHDRNKYDESYAEKMTRVGMTWSRREAKKYRASLGCRRGSAQTPHRHVSAPLPCPLITKI